MSHSIDFHASQTAMNDQMVEIKPGATFTYTFTADYAGVWMYHCGTAPALHHIANGMFGMVIVEPKGGLPKVDQEVALVQSEWYLGAQGQPADYAKANAAAPAPDFVVFNGVANQYKDNPIKVTTKGRVRVFVLDAGPNIDSSFHVVGTIFDTVIKEGIVARQGQCRRLGQPGGRPRPGPGRDHRVQPPGGRDVPVRDPRLQLRRARRDRALHGRRRRPEELSQTAVRLELTKRADYAIRAVLALGRGRPGRALQRPADRRRPRRSRSGSCRRSWRTSSRPGSSRAAGPVRRLPPRAAGLRASRSSTSSRRSRATAAPASASSAADPAG